MPRKKAKITVRVDDIDVACEVVERMGYNHDVGMYATLIQLGEEQKIAVRPPNGTWRLWTARDRVQPLVEHIARCAREGWDPFPPR
jgi:hypothetical protein